MAPARAPVPVSAFFRGDHRARPAGPGMGAIDRRGEPAGQLVMASP
jgi:hypothetical protein